MNYTKIIVPHHKSDIFYMRYNLFDIIAGKIILREKNYWEILEYLNKKNINFRF